MQKFSKFIHGTAVLIPDLVQAVPYWFDDVSTRESIILSHAAEVSFTRPRVGLEESAPTKVPNGTSNGIDGGGMGTLRALNRINGTAYYNSSSNSDGEGEIGQVGPFLTHVIQITNKITDLRSTSTDGGEHLKKLRLRRTRSRKCGNW